jgi:uncharacterized protein YndB with AHSA1/START domain
MKKIIFYGFLLMVIVTIALFIYESIKFKNYISSSPIHEPEEMKIPINQDAPVKSHSEIVINAPIEKVWQILTTINDWPNWQTEVTESNLKEGLKEGVEFTWKAGGLTFTSQIHTLEPKIKFGWTGKTIGASAIHNWFFRSEGQKTTVFVEESLQGVFPTLFKGYFQKNLDKGVQKNLTDLKTASEK